MGKSKNRRLTLSGDNASTARRPRRYAAASANAKPPFCAAMANVPRKALLGPFTPGEGDELWSEWTQQMKITLESESGVSVSYRMRPNYPCKQVTVSGPPDRLYDALATAITRLRLLVGGALPPPPQQPAAIPPAPWPPFIPLLSGIHYNVPPPTLPPPTLQAPWQLPARSPAPQAPARAHPPQPVIIEIADEQRGDDHDPYAASSRRLAPSAIRLVPKSMSTAQTGRKRKSLSPIREFQRLDRSSQCAKLENKNK